MQAAVATSQNPDDPLSGLVLQQVETPEPEPGWQRLRVRAASLNHHDLWSLRGVGLDPKKLPIVLGCDVAGETEDGREVVIHSIIGNPDGGRGDETLDPASHLLSEQINGGFAEYVVVPERNLLDKPAHLSFEEASCLPVAWGTAYRLLFHKAAVQAGDTVLVQGAGGGVATAAIALGAAGGLRVWATSRTEEKRQLALDLGADRVFETGERLPERVDAVIETVGEATWGHSLRCLRPGGVVAVAGATTGFSPPAELNRIFAKQLQVHGSTCSTRTETEQMLQLVASAGLRPRIDRTLPLDRIHEGFQAMIDGELQGKVVITP